MLQKRVIEYPGLGPVTFWRRAGNRSIRISVKAEPGVLVTYPWYTPFAQAERFLLQNIGNINKMLSRGKSQKRHSLIQNYLNGNFGEPQQISTLRQRAKEALPLRTAQIAAAMRTLHKRPFAYQRIAIKLNKTNWGSCSAKNNLNLNLALPLLPDALRDYVIIHELCHLEHHNHSAEFHRLLNSSCLALLGRPERELVKELRGYCI
ncbi:MAG: DUF45 domain-containing protein [bacterium]|nr:DUF45 domain-containing protein [bacterium]MDY2650445.1 YgjP-like metallopeptidase domain-containing protein [Candidatus Egerieousia sp.]